MRHPAQRGERKAAKERHAARRREIEARFDHDTIASVREEPIYTGTQFRKVMPQEHEVQR